MQITTSHKSLQKDFNRLSIRFGGMAGDGLQSTGMLILKFFNRLGYYVKGFPGTQSTIRGGHVWQHVEVSTEEFDSYSQEVDILIALRDVCLVTHLRDVKEAGLIIYNSDLVKITPFLEEIKSKSIIQIPVRMSKIAREVDPRTKVLVNSVAVSILIHIIGVNQEIYHETLRRRFSNRENILNMNLEVMSKGIESIDLEELPRFKLESIENKDNTRYVISGNEMIALGAVASGLKFLAQYPITPASSILTYLSNRARNYGIVVRQAEDELAAISMIIGASFTGVRSMTATSGPGLSLMAEVFGYSSMTETPIVVVNSMRGGPSTGIPTKMEQADLNSSIYLSHGESPRAIFAPRNIQECFDVTVRAFNLADKYQIPVIILSDFALSERTENLEEFNLDVSIDRGKIWTEPTEEFPEFKRHVLTEDGISPRVFPPTPNAMYIAVGAEHDESSHSLSGNLCGLPESGAIREQMFHKRYKKLESLRGEMIAPEFHGNSNATYTILCWGSTQGAVKEVVDFLISKGKNWNMLSFSDLFPLPFEKLKPILNKIKTGIFFEVNYTGQLEMLIYNHTGWRPSYSIHPLTGENPTGNSILKNLHDTVGGIM